MAINFLSSQHCPVLRQTRMIEFATLPIGSTLSDFFDVNDIIGEGSFGIVYRAVCRMTGTYLAQ